MFCFLCIFYASCEAQHARSSIVPACCLASAAKIMPVCGPVCVLIRSEYVKLSHCISYVPAGRVMLPARVQSLPTEWCSTCGRCSQFCALCERSSTAIRRPQLPPAVLCGAGLQNSTCLACRQVCSCCRITVAMVGAGNRLG